MSNARATNKLTNIGKLKVPLIPGAGGNNIQDGHLFDSDAIVTLANLTEHRGRTLNEEVVELSDDDDDIDDVDADIVDLKGDKAEVGVELKGPKPASSEKSGADETLAKAQILLLNGQEYEIVPIGGGRWISKNEYQLQKALKSVKKGQGSSSNDSGINGRASSPADNNKSSSSAGDCSVVSTQDNHVSSSKTAVSPPGVLLLNGKSMTKDGEMEEEESSSPHVKRMKRADANDDVDQEMEDPTDDSGLITMRPSTSHKREKGSSEGKSQVIMDLSDIMSNGEADEGEGDMVINEETTPITTPVNSAESCDRKCRRTRRKASLNSLGKTVPGADLNILESLLK